MAYDPLQKMTPKEALYYILLHNPDKTGAFDIGELESRMDKVKEDHPKLKELLKKYKTPLPRGPVNDLQTILMTGFQHGELLADPKEKRKAYLSDGTKRSIKHTLGEQFGSHVFSMYKEMTKQIWADY